MVKRQTLYQSLLGEDYLKLPITLQKLHEFENMQIKRYDGICDVRVGRNPIARLMRWIMGLPQESTGLPLKVYFERSKGVESWVRYFGRRRFQSKQWQVGDLLYEKLAFLTLIFKVSGSREGLILTLKEVLFLKIPIKKLYPLEVMGREWEDLGKFNFSVSVKAPLIGIIIEYSGKLDVKI